MEDDKLKAILGGSVDDGVGSLGKLTRDDLTALHDMEGKGAKRTTMLAAIDRALKALLADDATGKDAGGTGGGDNAPVTYSQDQVDTMLAQQRDAQAGMFTREQVDAMIAERDTLHAAEKERAVAEATGATAATVRVELPGALTIAEGADNPSLTALSSVSSIQFVDQSDRPLPGLPAMTFTPQDFEPNGAAVTLKIDVEFPKEIPATEVSGAFLLDDDDEPVGKATLVMPFAIGGGKTARLAKSTLSFAA